MVASVDDLRNFHLAEIVKHWNAMSQLSNKTSGLHRGRRPTRALRRRALDFDKRTILELGLFDAEYYRRNNPDIVSAGVDPLEHYAEQGWREGRRPSAEFDPVAYLEAHPDAAAAGVSPLLHWIGTGPMDDRQIAPDPHEVDKKEIPRIGLFSMPNIIVPATQMLSWPTWIHSTTISSKGGGKIAGRRRRSIPSPIWRPTPILPLPAPILCCIGSESAVRKAGGSRPTRIRLTRRQSPNRVSSMPTTIASTTRTLRAPKLISSTTTSKAGGRKGASRRRSSRPSPIWKPIPISPIRSTRCCTGSEPVARRAGGLLSNPGKSTRRRSWSSGSSIPSSIIFATRMSGRQGTGSARPLRQAGLAGEAPAVGGVRPRRLFGSQP